MGPGINCTNALPDWHYRLPAGQRPCSG